GGQLGSRGLGSLLGQLHVGDALRHRRGAGGGAGQRRVGRREAGRGVVELGSVSGLLRARVGEGVGAGLEVVVILGQSLPAVALSGRRAREVRGGRRGRGFPVPLELAGHLARALGRSRLKALGGVRGEVGLDDALIEVGVDLRGALGHERHGGGAGGGVVGGDRGLAQGIAVGAGVVFREGGGRRQQHNEQELVHEVTPRKFYLLRS